MSESLPPNARVFAVASGKGGVGKTTTAVNVGAALAESGADTVVVDADLGMANVADLLDLSISGPTLQAVLAGELPVEKATYRTHAGMAVVPGATDLASYAEVDPARLREVVADLRAEFEYVFLDAGAGLSHDAALPLGLADAGVLVTTPWETAARDAGKTRELAERIDATVAGVVVTRVREGSSGLGPERIAETVGAPVLAAIPEDEVVRESLAAGRPAVTHAPDGRAATGYRRLAAVLTGHEGFEPVPESAAGATDDEPASLAELLEREAERADDVSALTDQGPPEPADEPEPAPDEAEPTLELEDDEPSGEPADRDEDGAPDEHGDDTSDEQEDDTSDTPGGPAADELDGDELDGDERPETGEAATSPEDEAAESEGEEETARTDGEETEESEKEEETEGAEGTDEPDGIRAEEDGDILIAEEEPLADDADGEDDDPDPGDGEDLSGADDPMADIPRFEDDTAEEFTRGADPADALAADPLEATSGDESLVDEEVPAEPDAEDDPSGDGAAANDETAGPDVEVDEAEADESDRTGLFGRLAGLFR